MLWKVSFVKDSEDKQLVEEKAIDPFKVKYQDYLSTIFLPQMIKPHHTAYLNQIDHLKQKVYLQYQELKKFTKSNNYTDYERKVNASRKAIREITVDI
jgi:hypothetical protein